MIECSKDGVTIAHQKSSLEFSSRANVLERYETMTTSTLKYEAICVGGAIYIRVSDDEVFM